MSDSSSTKNTASPETPPINPPNTLNAVSSAPSTEAPLTAPWSVQSILSTLPHPPPSTPPSTPLPFYHLLERLKTTKREGWRRFDIREGESIADHMYRMAIITLLCPASLASSLDLGKCTRMALVHDMAEALVGDITPVDPVTKGEKSRREAETMGYLSRTLLGKVDGGVQGEELQRLWEEYEEGKTPEAVFVHDVDKVELLLQMVEYERRGGGGVNLEEFQWVKEKVVGGEMRGVCEEVLRERVEFWRGLGEKEKEGEGER